MNTTYLLIGGNLGNRMAYLQQACQQIEQICGTIIQQSSIYQTAAWGVADQPDFYNQVLQLQTSLQPEILLKEILYIEANMGRVRVKKMGPRTIDIDILLYENKILNSDSLIIPHPRLSERRFVLVPLHEIAPNITHPYLNKTIHQLLLECKDTLDVYKI